MAEDEVITNWTAWLTEEREKYCETMRDIVAQRRSRIIHRQGPLVTAELPKILIPPPPQPVVNPLRRRR